MWMIGPLKRNMRRGGLDDIERRWTTTIRNNLRLIICCHEIVDQMAIEKDLKSMFLIKRKKRWQTLPAIRSDLMSWISSHPKNRSRNVRRFASYAKSARKQLRLRDVSNTCHRNGLLMISGLELNFRARNAPSCVWWTKIVLGHEILFSGWKHSVPSL